MSSLAITQMVIGGISAVEWILFFLKVLHTQFYAEWLILANPWILILEGVITGGLTYYAYANGGLRDYWTLVLNVATDLYVLSIGILQFFTTQNALKNAEDSVIYLPPKPAKADDASALL